MFFILLDDLEWMDCEQLYEDGLSPCCCIETSHENYQAWLNFGFSLEPEVRSELARRLAVEYDADVNSADHRHFGRLAGYTNRKLEHLTERGFQYCKCRKSGQYVVEKAEDLINSVRESIATRGEQVRKIKESVNQLKSAGESGNVSELQSKYENMFEELKSAFGTSFDPSRADWMFCERAILQGYSYNEIEEAMSESELTERKGKESEKLKYLERTIKKCFVWVELKKQGYSFDEVAGNLINMVTLERSNKRSSNQEEERDLGGPTPA